MLRMNAKDKNLINGIYILFGLRHFESVHRGTVWTLMTTPTLDKFVKLFHIASEIDK